LSVGRAARSWSESFFGLDPPAPIRCFFYCGARPPPRPSVPLVPSFSLVGVPSPPEFVPIEEGRRMGPFLCVGPGRAARPWRKRSSADRMMAVVFAALFRWSTRSQIQSACRMLAPAKSPSPPIPARSRFQPAVSRSPGRPQWGGLFSRDPRSGMGSRGWDPKFFPSMPPGAFVLPGQSHRPPPPP